MPSRSFAKATSLVVSLVSLLLSVAGAIGLLSFDGVGILPGGPLWCRLVHPFVHAGVLHALLNVYVFLQLVFFFPLRCRHLLFAYLVACSCPVTVAVWGGGVSGLSVTGVVGLSGMEYVLMGWVMPGVPCRWRFNMQLFLWMSAGLVTGGVAVGFHLYCYLLGVVAAMLLRRR